MQKSDHDHPAGVLREVYKNQKEIILTSFSYLCLSVVFPDSRNKSCRRCSIFISVHLSPLNEHR